MIRGLIQRCDEADSRALAFLGLGFTLAHRHFNHSDTSPLPTRDQPGFKVGSLHGFPPGPHFRDYFVRRS